MRKHTLYLLLAGWGLLAASCYDDKSTLQTTHIPPVRSKCRKPSPRS